MFHKVKWLIILNTPSQFAINISWQGKVFESTLHILGRSHGLYNWGKSDQYFVQGVCSVNLLKNKKQKQKIINNKNKKLLCKTLFIENFCIFCYKTLIIKYATGISDRPKTTCEEETHFKWIWCGKSSQLGILLVYVVWHIALQTNLKKKEKKLQIHFYIAIFVILQFYKKYLLRTTVKVLDVNSALWYDAFRWCWRSQVARLLHHHGATMPLSLGVNITNWFLRLGTDFARLADDYDRPGGCVRVPRGEGNPGAHHLLRHPRHPPRPHPLLLPTTSLQVAPNYF